jgi:hypothetical protein
LCRCWTKQRRLRHKSRQRDSCQRHYVSLVIGKKKRLPFLRRSPRWSWLQFIKRRR